MLLTVNAFEIFYPIIKPFLPFAILGLVIAVFFALIDFKKYRDSSYYKITQNGYFPIWFDKGKLGEYHIYKYLRNLEKSGAKFLFNVYIPKESGETTEIDVLLITTKGIFVFESKNYSGWIFGSENQRYWTQTLPQGREKSRKEQFFNPIMQNAGHIKHLKSIIGDEIPLFSIIVFSERCTLKKITLTSDVRVINRYNVPQTVASIIANNNDLLDDKKIDEIYNKLYIYTQADEKTKQQHIQNINSKLETNVDMKSFDANQNSKCAICGGDLVLRVTKKGENAGKEFYGCSNFPKCRYIKDKE